MDMESTRVENNTNIMSVPVTQTKMADDERVPGTSESKYMTRSRMKKMKPEYVEISDSSSESNDEGVASLPTAKTLKSNPMSNVASSESSMECPVCLQTCIHPARLPCGHIFCFLCLKGIAQQSHRCAMCRMEIPSDYLEKPDLLQGPTTNAEKETFEDGYQWFYEGRNGWWQYDERTSRELESSYKAELKTCELLIAGFLYIADFDSMLQTRRNEAHRRRRIKRDLANIPKKGIAGIRQNVNVDSISEQLSALSINDAVSDQV